MNFCRTILVQILTVTMSSSPMAFAQNAGEVETQKMDSFMGALDKVDSLLSKDAAVGSLFFDPSGRALDPNQVLGAEDFFYKPARAAIGKDLTFRIKSEASDNEATITVAVYDAPAGKRLESLSRTIVLSNTKSPEENRIVFDQTVQSLTKSIEAANLASISKNKNRSPAGLVPCLIGLVGATFILAIASAVVRTIAKRLLPSTAVAEKGGLFKALKTKWGGLRLDSKIAVIGGLGLLAVASVIFAMYSIVEGFARLWGSSEDVPMGSATIGLPLLVLYVSCAG